ncbi:LacI family DNA-binding transcriptional regulator [Bifidobacterium felsineum]|uniref:LacI family transcriptional regulator n=1 Tax=Bifidobacterium felsineum TaxID=2045440 RepID=A0A2M9HJ57_9BIFI|nr:LacI family DNA-binding transcriptional regulator [Bifidobacterium felsineum]MBT1163729.1 LacI family DNA-binding transcriptional regulator [Bifidobacterium felsineum]PJM76849.1 LacI family transcriptional regulator [Bifidobacterium felsineum]
MAGIKDVAALAGVSISTVSYVMSGKRSIGEATKAKVMAAAKKLNYMPNAQARNLRGEPTKVLALSSPIHEYTDYSNYAVFFFALAMRAKRYGYDILLLMHEYGDQELTRIASSGMVDGILLLDVVMCDARADVARTLDLPVVAVGYPSNSDGIYSVDLDFERMGREAIEKAYALGHRHVLIAGTDQSAYEDGSNYLVRFRDAAAKKGDDLGVSVLFKPSTGFGRDDVNLMLDEALSEDPDISLIICQTNAVHITNVLNALHMRGLRVPEDVSVLAACTYGLGSLPRKVDELPMLPNETCSRAVDIMMEVLQGKRNDVGHVELLPSRYQARGTVAAH